MNQQQPTVPPTNQEASTSIKAKTLSLEEIQLTTQVASSQAGSTSVDRDLTKGNPKTYKGYMKQLNKRTQKRQSRR